MKLDSKLLLEQLIRTHILEQQIVTDTNVKRGKIGNQTIYGEIDNPRNVSPADSKFFNQVNSINRMNPKSKRPFIKIYSNVTRDGSVSESERLQSVANIARREASKLIDSFGGPGELNEYSAIISNPQDAKKQAEKSDTVSYDPNAKLYYTIVFIMTSDINSNISPDWGVVKQMKFFGEDQISSLKPIVAKTADAVSDDKSKSTQDKSTQSKSQVTPEQLSDQFITKKSQLDNLGSSGESAKNLQRAMYTFGMKESTGKLRKLPEFNPFVTASWNTTRAPGEWDGDIGRRSRDLIAILKAGFEVSTDEELYDRLKAAINEIQPNLTESKLYKLTEQSGFNIDKAEEASKKLRSVNQTDSSRSRESSTTTPVTKKAVWKCVLAAAPAAIKISVNGEIKQSTAITFDANWITQNQKNIDYVTFKQNNKLYTYYPDATGFFNNDTRNKKRYTCENGVLKYFTAQVNKQDHDYQDNVIQRTNDTGVLIDGKSISQLIYDAAKFLKAFWAGDDLSNKYIYPWYSPFTAENGFKLAAWRDSYNLITKPSPAVVANYDYAVDKMITLLGKQINQMRNTEFYGMMDALYNISPTEVGQLKTLKQLQRDVKTQAGDKIFNQVTSKPFTIWEFEKEPDSDLISDNVFQENPVTSKKIVTVDYE
jgi:hypothetical protein